MRNLFLVVGCALAITAKAALDPDLLAGMQARNIGPAGMSGRISATASVASDPKTIVIGAASGGVWRSDNGGLS